MFHTDAASFNEIWDQESSGGWLNAAQKTGMLKSKEEFFVTSCQRQLKPNTNTSQQLTDRDYQWALRLEFAQEGSSPMLLGISCNPVSNRIAERIIEALRSVRRVGPTRLTRVKMANAPAGRSNPVWTLAPVGETIKNEVSPDEATAIADDE